MAEPEIASLECQHESTKALRPSSEFAFAKQTRVHRVERNGAAWMFGEGGAVIASRHSFSMVHEDSEGKCNGEIVSVR